MKKMIPTLLAGLFVSAFAYADSTYVAEYIDYETQRDGNIYSEKYMITNNTGYMAANQTTKMMSDKNLARNYRGGWNSNWSHPEWGYSNEVWGIASTLDMLADPSSAYKTKN